jgi:hypothetical protein
MYKAEYLRLQMKASHHSQILASSILKYNETETYYHSIYLPSMQYSLVVGTFSENQTHLIQSPVSQVVLTGLGYCSRSPLAIVYGPLTLGGIGLRHLFAEQGSLKLQALIQNIRCKSRLGQLMTMQIQWAQLICGTSKQILADVKTNLPMLKEELWISSLRDFLSKSEISVHIPAIVTAVPQRKNDISIMEKAISLGFKPHELLRINRCRIYLRASTISDISSADGTAIRNGIRECIEEAHIQSHFMAPSGSPRPKFDSILEAVHKKYMSTGNKIVTSPVTGMVQPTFSESMGCILRPTLKVSCYYRL